MAAEAAFQSRETEAHETRTLSLPLSDLHVLKSGDSFGVFSNAGDIRSQEHSPEGLFVFDTRVVSQWRLMLDRADLQVLSHAIDASHVMFTVHLASKAFTDLGDACIGENAIYIRREQFLKKGTLFERVTIENHETGAVRLRLGINFRADFYDMFQVRGLQRAQHGTRTDIKSDAHHVQFNYTGKDSCPRSSVVRFSEKPSSLTSSRAEFNLSLSKGGSHVIIVSAGSDAGALDNNVFEERLDAARQQVENRLGHWTDVKTGDNIFDAWLERSRVGISLLNTLRQTGLYPYAGIPWFSAPFGRDGIITALQTLWLNPHIAEGVLKFLAETQAREYEPFRDAEPGKILHELRECEMAATGEVPYGRYYGSIDSTPLFIILAAAYYRRTGNLDFIRALWPSIEAALEWMEKDGDADGDGFLEYQCKEETGLYNQGWKDSQDSIFHADGSIAALPIATCEVQAYAYAAFKDGAELARALDKEANAARLLKKAEHIYERVNEEFWSEELGCYALALDGQKKPCLVRSSNNGHMLWCGIAPPGRAVKIADMLMRPDFFTGWGIRTIAKGEARYNPLSYHNGSVWPHDTAIAAAGMARYGFYDKAETLLDGLSEASKDCGNDWLPELFCGFSRRAGHVLVRYPAACTLQAWSCGSVFMALQAAAGIEYDGEAGRFTVKNGKSRFLNGITLMREGKILSGIAVPSCQEKDISS